MMMYTQQTETDTLAFKLVCRSLHVDCCRCILHTVARYEPKVQSGKCQVLVLSRPSSAGPWLGSGTRAAQNSFELLRAALSWLSRTWVAKNGNVDQDLPLVAFRGAPYPNGSCQSGAEGVCVNPQKEESTFCHPVKLGGSPPISIYFYLHVITYLR